MSKAKDEISASIKSVGNDSFKISASDTQYLVLKDTVDKHTKYSSLVQVSTDSLSTIGDFLVQIKDKYSELENKKNNQEVLSLNKDIKAIENQLSSYISGVMKNATEKNVNISSVAIETETKFFDSVMNKGNFSNIEAKALAEIEVNFAHGVAESITNHNSMTCAICQSKANKTDSNGGMINTAISGYSGGLNVDSRNSNIQPHYGSTSNAQSDTGFSSNATTSVQELDSLMLAGKWKVSAGQTLSYSYYTTSGSAYTYNVNATTDVSSGASYVGTAGNSLLGGSGDTAANLDAVFTDWDNAGAWTFEKITESGSTVGEIRSRILTDVGDVSYSAFASGPGNSAQSGDVWYTQGYSTSFDQGSFNYYTALHEVGHAVGLSHPFDGGGRGSTTLADNKDFVRNTVMSYTSNDRNYYFVPDNTASPTSISSKRWYPTDPGLLDVNVIEHMYGTATSTNAGDTIYTFDDKPVFIRTLIDSGGIDTIDASNQTEEVVVNLNGGTAASIGIWSSAEQLAHYSSYGINATSTVVSVNAGQASGSNKSPFAKGWYEGIDNLQLPASSIIENVKGGAKADILTGNSSDNEITGNGGNDIIEGGAGSDTAVYTGAKANYTITDNGSNNYTIADNVGTDGTDTVNNVEIAKFSDVNLTLADGTSIVRNDTKPADLTKSYRPVVRINLSINVDAFPVLARLNIPQIQSFTRGVASGNSFSSIPTSEAKALFTDGLKTEAEIQSALTALDELLKQISEQQIVLATAESNVNQSFASVISGATDASQVEGVSRSLVAEVESAGFVGELMTAIRAQIQAIVDSQLEGLTQTSEQDVVDLLK
jgi:hypothetical protein